MSNKQKIFQYIKSIELKQICDDCLSQETKIQHRQTPNVITKTLHLEQKIVKTSTKYICNFCRKKKFVSYLK